MISLVFAGAADGITRGYDIDTGRLVLTLADGCHAYHL